MNIKTVIIGCFLIFITFTSFVFLKKEPALPDLISYFPWSKDTSNNEHHHNVKRSVEKKELCSSHIKVDLTAENIPFYKMDLHCMQSSSDSCRTSCIAQKTLYSLNPRLKFLGVRIVNGTEEVYFREMTDEEYSVACLCS